MLARKLKKRGSGFTLIELAIVLGVVGVMAAGLWRLMATGNQQTKDQNTAQQQLALISAVKGYLNDVTATGGQAWMTTLTNNQTANLPLPTSFNNISNCQANITGGATGAFAAFCNYLPTGFTSTTTNPYNQTYWIQVLKDNTPAGTAPNSYSFMIMTTGGSVIPDVDGGRISSVIGGDGGFVYSSSTICGANAPTACGALGSWSIPTTNYGFGTAPAPTAVSGDLASRTFVSASAATSGQWLARIVIDPAYVNNTMITDLYMGVTGAGAATNIKFPTTGVSGSIQLSNSYITGSGAVGINQPQINLASNPNLTNLPLLSLIQLASGCSAITAPGNCGPALYVSSGDISVPNGEVAAQKIFSVSDARLKTDIHPIANALDGIMQLNPVSFTFKSNGSKSMGVTAQNLEKVYPELVSESAGHKVVEYNGLIGPLIGAVQELKRENDALRNQLRIQSEREDALERKLEHP